MHHDVDADDGDTTTETVEDLSPGEGDAAAFAITRRIAPRILVGEMGKRVSKRMRWGWSEREDVRCILTTGMVHDDVTENTDDPSNAEQPLHTNTNTNTNTSVCAPHNSRENVGMV